jgi:alkylation response protein AidB-like acyl-CoA dehydrogenase
VGPAASSQSSAWAEHAVPTYLNLRKASIYGGSNEIQRQIIARTILGL